MRKQLGVLLVEDEEGKFSVQLFEEFAKAKEVFEQLTGSQKLRATFISMDWEKKFIEGLVKELPESLKGERMDRWELGKGPIYSVKPFGTQEGK
jgi:hypothetical protein